MPYAPAQPDSSTSSEGTPQFCGCLQLSANLTPKENGDYRRVEISTSNRGSHVTQLAEVSKGVNVPSEQTTNLGV